MTKRLSLFILCISICAFCFAQEEQTISADRPGMSTGTDVMPLHKVQWETGVAFDWEHRGGAKQETFTINNTLFRYGLTNFAEIRLGMDFQYYRDRLFDDYVWGVTPLNFGTKIKVYEGTKYLPAISFLANVVAPHLGTKAFCPTHLAPSMHLLFSNTITDWLGLGYQVGCDWDGISPVPTTFLAVCFGFSITDNLGAFVESYNNFTRWQTPECSLDFGFNWLVHRKVQLDVAANINFNEIKSYANVSMGVAWLIN